MSMAKPTPICPDRFAGHGRRGGVDYTYDAVKHIITVKTAAGGSLTVEFDTAKFIYEGKALSSYWDKFGYTIQDMDGDTASTVKDVKVVYDGGILGPSLRRLRRR
jgi:hypothetical protein